MIYFVEMKQGLALYDAKELYTYEVLGYAKATSHVIN